VAGNPRGAYDPQYSNLAPRVGATWSSSEQAGDAAPASECFYTPAIEFGDYQG